MKTGREAAELYLRAWKTRPLQARDETVGDRLEALEQQLETPVRTAAAWYERGSALLRRSRNERALEAFDRAFALGECHFSLLVCFGTLAESEHGEPTGNDGGDVILDGAN